MMGFLELASLWLTVVFIVMAVDCVKMFYPEAKAAIKALRAKDLVAPIAWVSLGVVFSFGGQIADNIYWFAAWAAEYIEHPIRQGLFKYGVVSNIPFRQLAGIVGVYCHVRGIIAMAEALGYEAVSVRELHTQVAKGIALAFAVVAVLIFIKHF